MPEPSKHHDVDNRLTQISDSIRLLICLLRIAYTNPSPID